MVNIEKYKDLIERLERFAARAPRRYRLRLVALALLGYAVIGGALLLLLGMSGVAVALIVTSEEVSLELLKAVVVPIILAAFMVNAMWVYLPPPRGFRVSRRQSAALVDEVERLRRAMNAPRIDEILITDRFDAAAVALPRAGIFGWHRRYLVLGLPMMLAIDRERLSAVIARELGRHSRNHGQFHNWIYRVRETWLTLLDSLRGSKKQGFLKGFFEWYSPYFEAYSFVLARRNEYDADAGAAVVIGADKLAHALATLAAAEQFLRAIYWPLVLGRSSQEPQPPDDVFEGMERALISLDGATTRACLTEVGNSPATLLDARPALEDRLRALGQSRPEVRAIARSAAIDMLGSLAETLKTQFGGQWADHNSRDWGVHFRGAELSRARLRELQDLQHEGALGIDERVELAELAAMHDPAFDRKSAYLALLAEAPQQANVHFRLAKMLLADNTAGAVEHFEQAMLLDPRMSQSACLILAEHFAQRDDTARQRHYADRLADIRARQQSDAAARTGIGDQDAFAPHGLDPATIKPFAHSLSLFSTLARAWLVRKRLDHDPPHFVILLDFVGEVDHARLQRVAGIEGLPGTLIAINAAGSGAARRAIQRVAVAPIFTRGWSAPRILLERLLKLLSTQRESW